MSAPGLTKRPLLSGRLAAFLGIALIALGLRSAVSSFAPMMHEIEKDIPFTEVTYGIFGMLAPLTFAVSGAFTPWLSRKLSLEWAAVLAAAFMGVGQLLRGFAGDTASFFLYSIAGMMGIGAANVLLPPLVKRFFPDRIPLVSQLYLVLAVVSSIFPAVLCSAARRCDELAILDCRLECHRDHRGRAVVVHSRQGAR